MTDKEKALLEDALGSGTQLTDGTLLSYQKELLRQLRTADAYLSSKYPSDTPEIHTFVPSIDQREQAVCYVRMSSGEDCEVTLTPENGEYICADTCYGILMRERYDREVEDLLAGIGVRAVSYTDFPTPVGLMIDGSSSAADLNAVRPPVLRQTDLFIEDTADRAGVQSQIQSLLNERGFYGAYILCFVPGLGSEDAASLEARKQDLERTAFTCYDVK